MPPSKQSERLYKTQFKGGDDTALVMRGTKGSLLTRIGTKEKKILSYVLQKYVWLNRSRKRRIAGCYETQHASSSCCLRSCLAMSPKAMALSSSSRDLSTKFSNFSPLSIARSRASLTAACVSPNPPAARPAAASPALPSPTASRFPNNACLWCCAWAWPPPLARGVDVFVAEKAAPAECAPTSLVDWRRRFRRGDGSLAKTSVRVFLDTPRESRLITPLEGLFLDGTGASPVSTTLLPSDGCLPCGCIAGGGDGRSNVETLIKRGFELINASHASSVSIDQRVNSCRAKQNSCDKSTAVSVSSWNASSNVVGARMRDNSRSGKYVNMTI